jgi:hypothetical protein
MTNAFEDFYIDLLNEYGDVKIGNLTFSPADIIKALDPIAYNEGLLDFEDMMLENAELEEAL